MWICNDNASMYSCQFCWVYNKDNDEFHTRDILINQWTYWSVRLSSYVNSISNWMRLMGCSSKARWHLFRGVPLCSITITIVYEHSCCFISLEHYYVLVCITKFISCEHASNSSHSHYHMSPNCCQVGFQLNTIHCICNSLLQLEFLSGDY